MTTSNRPVGRLAPTPSGMLHLGNICAFAAAWLSIRSTHGTLQYRIEDIDTTRARPDIGARQKEDLRWLGFDWDEETANQSTRDYGDALRRLASRTYFCECTRASIRAQGGIHPKVCIARQSTQGATRLLLRNRTQGFEDLLRGPQEVDLTQSDDPVLRRRDGIISYTLAVVADDIRDGVTQVVRGADLLEATGVQLELWELLNAPAPTWLHTPLILGPDGRKLSKSHGSTEIAHLRSEGYSPASIWSIVLPWLGISEADSLEEALQGYRPDKIAPGPITVAHDLG